MEKGRIAVVGPGAMGCLFAARLARGEENEVWLLDRTPREARLLDRRGIRISGLSRMTLPADRTRVVADARRIGVCDVVLVMVKSYDTGAAAAKARACVGPGTLVVTLQNGFGNVEAIRGALPRRFSRNVAGGTTAHGATLVGPGWVRHAGRGETMIGFDTAEQERKVRAFAQRLTAAGIETGVRKGIEALIWAKVVLNSGINPLAAILRVPNGELVRNAWARKMMCAVVEESERVMRASGVRLPFADPCRKAVEVCNMTAVNVNSMLQDILVRRRTEVDAMNGAIVRQAGRIRMRAPLNVACWRIVRSIEVS